jgi:hypothetical protein
LLPIGAASFRALKSADRAVQGCQIFLDTTYQNEEKFAKLSQNIPHSPKIDQSTIKYTNILHCKTLKDLPNLGFWA